MSLKTIKTILILFLLLFTPLIIGCKKDPFKEAAEGMIDSYEGSKVAAAQANLKSLQDAVRIYQTENNKFPETLEEVAGLMNSKIDLELYDYDPSSGRVSLKINK